jgi:hypothetical protein
MNAVSDADVLGDGDGLGEGDAEGDGDAPGCADPAAPDAEPVTTWPTGICAEPVVTSVREPTGGGAGPAPAPGAP